jgi:UDP-N-acetylmuramoyl-tripeptide--D-alanyl-D-alanine ligase
VDARTLQYVSESVGGEFRGRDPGLTVRRVVTDSRQVEAGDLFIALAGERFDGHDFLHEVAGRHAAGMIVERSRSPRHANGTALIVVDDTRRALAALAARYRGEFSLPVVAVAGSNGKTTTKELLAALLRQRHPTLWSEASFNNDIGVPLTLLRLTSEHRAAVLEVGTNHPGELPALVRLIRPSHGVITSLGREHLEFFGSLEGVAAEEGWLAELLPADGKLFVNGDSPLIGEVARRSRAPVVRVGRGPHNDWRVSEARVEWTGTTFSVQAPDGAFSGTYQIPLLGRHQAVNATLALAVASELGVTLNEVRAGFAQVQPPKMRLNASDCGGVRVLDDCYNANADSMLAGLQTLCDLPCPGRRIAVLGPMGELGEQAAAAHAEVGRRAAELGVHRLFAIGAHAATLADAARAAGLAEVEEFADAGVAATAVQQCVRAGDVVLVKASRAARLEQVVERLRG